jgi:hypothetical protein
MNTAYLLDTLLKGVINLGLIALVLVPLTLVQRWRQKKAFGAQFGDFRAGRHAATQARTRATIDPNAESDVKVIQTELNIEETIKLGTPSFIYVRQHPDTMLRGQEIVTNAPDAEFVWIAAFMVANVNCIVGIADALMFTSGRLPLDLPTASPASAFTLVGWYTGLVPEGMKAGDAFKFRLSVRGPSTLTDGFGPIGPPPPSPPGAV